ncbi:multiheme c-type cytochrome [Salinibius halmophilus]|uniref:multiheme c-type cytochrome n=1 Tax=Salinibius halmophilus TaxID=1853216 RepID=UPI000E6636E9|nr:multiheme c-type cytochrome [Salinibius halmophilus]
MRYFFICLLALLLASLGSAETRDIDIPFYQSWVNSPHADLDSPAFNHWEEEDDKLVPERCAACHSTTGHLDYLGADGSTPYQVDAKAPGLEGVQCTACHNRAVSNMTEVRFPSGSSVTRVEADARCMDCHQGRASGASVDEMVAEAAVEADQIHQVLKFINVHYSPAAATRFGKEAGGGYEYAGKDYVGFFYHDDFATQCNDCHRAHSTQVKVNLCSDCHRDATSEADWASIRSKNSTLDYDGDGEESGIKVEVETLHELLYATMQDYASQVLEAPVLYDSGVYPYFFNDSNGNGVNDPGEAIYPNAYKSWSPRLVKAAYNYQFVAKDHGAWAHNGQYVLQLLHDSIADLGEAVAIPPIERAGEF